MSEKRTTPEQENEPSLSDLLRIQRDKLSEMQEEGQDPFKVTKFDVTAHSAKTRDELKQWTGRRSRWPEGS